MIGCRLQDAIFKPDAAYIRGRLLVIEVRYSEMPYLRESINSFLFPSYAFTNLFNMNKGHTKLQAFQFLVSIIIVFNGCGTKQPILKRDKTADFQNGTKQPIFKTEQNECCYSRYAWK